MRVWVLTFVEDPDTRVAASAQKAYEICKENIEQESRPAYREKWLKELEEEYNEDPEWFGCTEICSAQMIEVEGA